MLKCNTYHGWEQEYEQEYEGLHSSDLHALKYAWTQFLDFAYSPYKPDQDELHGYMQQMGRILGDMPPDVLPFSGTAEIN